MPAGPPPGRFAAIDAGTNTFKIIVAEPAPSGGFLTVLDRSVPCRLGEGAQKSGRLAAPAMERGLAVLRDFKSQAEDAGASPPAVFATSAVRSAANGELFAKLVRDETGLRFRVLSGEEEAALVFRGAATAPGMPGGHEILVMDLGGGSAEFVRGVPGAIRQKASLNVGCVRMTDLFLSRRPVPAADRANLDAHLAAAFQPLIAHFGAAPAMAATGGTICALANAIDPEFWDRMREGVPFPLASARLAPLVDELAAMTLEQIRATPGIPDSRADVIVAGGLTYLAAFRAMGHGRVFVTHRGLRYGIAAAMSAGEIEP